MAWSGEAPEWTRNQNEVSGNLRLNDVVRLISVPSRAPRYPTGSARLFAQQQLFRNVDSESFAITLGFSAASP
jgi:hypothetical protein